jgi:hypothetical protein
VYRSLSSSLRSFLHSHVRVNCSSV